LSNLQRLLAGQDGYGAYWEDLNKERVEHSFYNVPQYAEKLATYPRQGNEALLTN